MPRFASALIGIAILGMVTGVNSRAPLPKSDPYKKITINLGDGVSLELVRIEAGKFMMGPSQSEVTYFRKHHNIGLDEKELHSVEITNPFWIGTYPVTQEQYTRLMGANPSSFSHEGVSKDKVAKLETHRFPVESVSWDDAMSFCQKLNNKHLVDVPSSLKRDGYKFDLPTEAQWEYSCRAGTTTAFHFGDVLDGTQANCQGDQPYGTEKKGPTLDRTSQVGSYKPNAWGLYDMHGNVCQWCFDYFDRKDREHLNAPIKDPVCLDFDDCRRVRGGSYRYAAKECRSADRCGQFNHKGCSDWVGFRVVLRVQ